MPGHYYTTLLTSVIYYNRKQCHQWHPILKFMNNSQFVLYSVITAIHFLQFVIQFMICLSLNARESECDNNGGKTFSGNQFQFHGGLLRDITSQEKIALKVNIVFNFAHVDMN